MRSLNIYITLLLFLCSTSRSTASRQVTLTCGTDEETNRGFPGSPGKRGAIGLPGLKGEPGMKGEMGESEDYREAISRLERLINELEDQLVTANQTITEMRREVQLNVVPLRSNCDEIFNDGLTLDGVYAIVVGGKVMKVYCEFQKEGDNWLVLQVRKSGSQDFFKGWQEYSIGFGDISGEFWLGLENLHIITSSASHRLRVDLEDWNGNTAYAEYSVFSVGSSSTNYRLNVEGHNGTAGNGFDRHNNKAFSTKDRDNDIHKTSSCAATYHGAWWYEACHHSNLNGLYTREQGNCNGLGWYGFPGSSWCNSMKKTKMKIRPN